MKASCCICDTQFREKCLFTERNYFLLQTYKHLPLTHLPWLVPWSLLKELLNLWLKATGPKYITLACTTLPVHGYLYICIIFEFMRLE